MMEDIVCCEADLMGEVSAHLSKETVRERIDQDAQVITDDWNSKVVIETHLKNHPEGFLESRPA